MSEDRHGGSVAGFSAPGRRPVRPHALDEARFPIRGYYVPDDPIATPANVPPMLDLYREADIETQWIDPSDLNVSSVGHLGFFHSDVGRPLWDDALDWLNRQT